jgi:hypothetical protein
VSRAGYLVLIVTGLLGPPAIATEIAEREVLKNDATAKFEARDFAALDAMWRSFHETKARTSSGVWKQRFLHDGVMAAVVDDQDKLEPSAREQIAAWIAHSPESPPARVAMAKVMRAEAWSHRGRGYASTVPPEKWKPFHAGITEAVAYLNAHRAIADVDPAWYEQMLLNATAQDWDGERFQALFEEALQKEPHFYGTYFAALEYFLPKWHGSPIEIEAFARDAVRRTRDVEGTSMYARIYWMAAERQYKNRLLEDSKVVWVDLKKAFEDMIERYPSDWNRQNFAYFACLAKDKPVARTLMKGIPQRQPDMWDVLWARDCLNWIDMESKVSARAAQVKAFLEDRQREQLHSRLRLVFGVGCGALLVGALIARARRSGRKA